MEHGRQREDTAYQKVAIHEGCRKMWFRPQRDKKDRDHPYLGAYTL